MNTTITNTSSSVVADASLDVFGAANWFDHLWNSRARAVAPDRIEWQCRTWGSGAGRGCREDVAIFRVVAETFGLVTWSDDQGRDELVVEIPMELFVQVARVIDQLDESEPADWPWLDEDVEDASVVAAGVLGISVGAISGNVQLMDALGLA